ERDGWLAVGVDAFLRGYLDKRGRAAFYAAARNILLEEHDAFWAALKSLSPNSLFTWGHNDPPVPIACQRRLREALPPAEPGERIFANARGTAHPYGCAGRRPVQPTGFAQRLSGSSHAGGSTART